MSTKIGTKIAQGLGGGAIFSYVGDNNKVVKVMPLNADAMKEVMIQIYVNKMDPELAPRIYDYGQLSSNGALYMYVVMEKIDGTLDAQMKKGWTPSCDDVAVVNGLIERLHAIGVAHYDLHAGNIGYKVARGQMSPKIIDFGWAEISPTQVTPEKNMAMAKNAKVRTSRNKPYLDSKAKEIWTSFCKR
jgi:tRNA A-37 threonylcarbamoyl transferase component Bud32